MSVAYVSYSIQGGIAADSCVFLFYPFKLVAGWGRGWVLASRVQDQFPSMQFSTNHMLVLADDDVCHVSLQFYSFPEQTQDL
jgi:hypothetical protein